MKICFNSIFIRLFIHTEMAYNDDLNNVIDDSDSDDFSDSNFGGDNYDGLDDFQDLDRDLKDDDDDEEQE